MLMLTQKKKFVKIWAWNERGRKASIISQDFHQEKVGHYTYIFREFTWKYPFALSLDAFSFSCIKNNYRKIQRVPMIFLVYKGKSYTHIFLLDCLPFINVFRFSQAQILTRGSASVDNFLSNTFFRCQTLISLKNLLL